MTRLSFIHLSPQLLHLCIKRVLQFLHSRAHLVVHCRVQPLFKLPLHFLSHCSSTLILNLWPQLLRQLLPQSLIRFALNFSANRLQSRIELLLQFLFQLTELGRLLFANCIDSLFQLFLQFLFFHLPLLSLLLFALSLLLSIALLIHCSCCRCCCFSHHQIIVDNFGLFRLCRHSVFDHGNRIKGGSQCDIGGWTRYIFAFDPARNPHVFHVSRAQLVVFLFVFVVSGIIIFFVDIIRTKQRFDACISLSFCSGKSARLLALSSFGVVVVK
mmetsp:Transcript_15113/g.23684  ORF Transcript_15113/g.23684 Transcript_15113/m.23684 type:complete len:271 (-) Transcript_15113:274-1086(-)